MKRTLILGLLIAVALYITQGIPQISHANIISDYLIQKIQSGQSRAIQNRNSRNQALLNDEITFANLSIALNQQAFIKKLGATILSLKNIHDRISSAADSMELQGKDMDGVRELLATSKDQINTAVQAVHNLELQPLITNDVVTNNPQAVSTILNRVDEAISAESAAKSTLKDALDLLQVANTKN